MTNLLLEIVANTALGDDQKYIQPLNSVFRQPERQGHFTSNTAFSSLRKYLRMMLINLTSTLCHLHQPTQYLWPSMPIPLAGTSFCTALTTGFSIDNSDLVCTSTTSGCINLVLDVIFPTPHRIVVQTLFIVFLSTHLCNSSFLISTLLALR